MKSLLVVGGDNIEGLIEKLKKSGFDHVFHCNGRKANMTKISIPKKIDAILILTNYINHNLSLAIKRQAQERKIPVYYAKRSWWAIQEEVKKMPLYAVSQS
ncbi:dihydroorotate dehydrogenase [Priestia aryabhattai]|uniref:DUF2325 domain-containing protein n=1 Tax=Bacillaceae TaxID=186817 RepID=UPI000BA16B52|nr:MULTISPECIES: DUF2325 domain-containing protein [Bacillaceae]MDT2046105.1 DUF2325 domain-containing protein [Priestia flexa]OZT11959.1 dihydroorotate dehydrogenase [Priestia aryabhattai]TDB50193.1 DUF2325 domain-containing protein [Bacillus sp. CBEL-1]USY53865.1 DUF2325 domain-containing protein [Bacillus sp. 1780r2a1]